MTDRPGPTFYQYQVSGKQAGKISPISTKYPQRTVSTLNKMFVAVKMLKINRTKNI